MELGHVHAGAHGHRGGLGGGQHLRRVDQVVAELDHLAHARAPDVDDARRQGIERGRAPSNVASSPPTIRVSVPSSAPAVPPESGASR